MNQTIFTLTSASALAALLAVGGCGQREADNAKTMGNAPATQPEQKKAEVAPDVTAADKTAVDKVGDKVADAVITTSVKAELAKDANLSALKINVDTDKGRVALRGTAPDTVARERATTLAASVKGVLAVDNQLTVEPAKS